MDQHWDEGKDKGKGPLIHCSYATSNALTDLQMQLCFLWPLAAMDVGDWWANNVPFIAIIILQLPSPMQLRSGNIYFMLDAWDMRLINLIWFLKKFHNKCTIYYIILIYFCIYFPLCNLIKLHTDFGKLCYWIHFINLEHWFIFWPLVSKYLFESEIWKKNPTYIIANNYSHSRIKMNI